MAHWLEVLNRFDKILERVIDSFPELRLGIPATVDADSAPSRELEISSAPFPVELVDKVLRATDLILGHCHNAQLYPSGKVRFCPGCCSGVSGARGGCSAHARRVSDSRCGR